MNPEWWAFQFWPGAHLWVFAVEQIGIAALLIIMLRTLINQPRALEAYLLCGVLLSLACWIVLSRQDYGPWMPPDLRFDVGNAYPYLHAARNAGSAFFALLAYKLFTDHSKLPWWLVGAVALQMGLEFTGPLLDPEYNSQDAIVPALLQNTFTALAVYWTLADWRVDLINARRRGRLVAIVAFGVFGILSSLFLRLLVPGELVANYYLNAGLIFTATLTCLAILVWRLDLPPLLASEGATPAPDDASTPPDSAAYIQAIKAAFEADRAYRDGSLSIAALASIVQLPEYRLRKIIHEDMGYRNFNALLHDYRLNEIEANLADPEQARTPILTLALEAGYQSINPFNRAFKARHGITPSSFRRQKLSESH